MNKFKCFQFKQAQILSGKLTKLFFFSNFKSESIPKDEYFILNNLMLEYNMDSWRILVNIKKNNI